MREVKYRGTKGDGTWYIGDFISDDREYNRTCDKAFILPRWSTLNSPISVDTKSIGQYTDLKDINGEEIFEGDIVKVIAGRLFTVEYNMFCAFMLYPIDNQVEYRAIIQVLN